MPGRGWVAPSVDSGECLLNLVGPEVHPRSPETQTLWVAALMVGWDGIVVANGLMLYLF